MKPADYLCTRCKQAVAEPAMTDLSICCGWAVKPVTRAGVLRHYQWVVRDLEGALNTASCIPQNPRL